MYLCISPPESGDSYLFSNMDDSRGLVMFSQTECVKGFQRVRRFQGQRRHKKIPSQLIQSYQLFDLFPHLQEIRHPLTLNRDRRKPANKQTLQAADRRTLGMWRSPKSLWRRKRKQHVGVKERGKGGDLNLLVPANSFFFFFSICT